MSESELKDEIRRIMPERNKLLEQLAAIDSRILELAGIEQDKGTRNPPKKTLSRDLFRRACGA